MGLFSAIGDLVDSVTGAVTDALGITGDDSAANPMSEETFIAQAVENGQITINESTLRRLRESCDNEEQFQKNLELLKSGIAEVNELLARGDLTPEEKEDILRMTLFAAHANWEDSMEDVSDPDGAGAAGALGHMLFILCNPGGASGDDIETLADTSGDDAGDCNAVEESEIRSALAGFDKKMLTYMKDHELDIKPDNFMAYIYEARKERKKREEDMANMTPQQRLDHLYQTQQDARRRSEESITRAGVATEQA